LSDIERRPGERRTNPLAAIQLSGGLVSAASQLAVMPQDLTHVDLRKLDLARYDYKTAASVRGRGDGRPLPFRGRRDPRRPDGMNENAVAIVMVEHIMRAVTAFSQRLVVLVAGRKLADGNPQQVLANVEVQRAYLGE
jgi:branched-chain amino acid transport system ATP-binding protein